MWETSTAELIPGVNSHEAIKNKWELILRTVVIRSWTSKYAVHITELEVEYNSYDNGVN